MKNLFLLILFPLHLFAQYTGTGSVSQGIANTTNTNIYTCTGGRISNLGTVNGINDNSIWTVPAETNFLNNNFPFASNLYNSCTGATFANSNLALSNLDGTDIVPIDSTGELITAFIFADNYFEMYVNGIPVGKDNVPYTPFNSNIVRFKVNYPFTVAMKLVDWEENLGLGSEVSGAFNYHAGDGGMVAVFKNSNNSIIGTTNGNWKAQTFYSSPITDLSCPTEFSNTRLTNNCSTQDSNDGSNYYALHWLVPNNWMYSDFDDSAWPNANEYSNATVGVDNKPAYTNFVDIFDNTTNDAKFIWSTNLILDNEVIVRYRFEETSLNLNQKSNSSKINFKFNGDSKRIEVEFSSLNQNRELLIYSAEGKLVLNSLNFSKNIDLSMLHSGIYIVVIKAENEMLTKKIVLN